MYKFLLNRKLIIQIDIFIQVSLNRGGFFMISFCSFISIEFLLKRKIVHVLLAILFSITVSVDFNANEC